jgi:hypothetical protein
VTLLRWSRTKLLIIVAGVLLMTGTLAVIAGTHGSGNPTGVAAAERSRFDNGLGYTTAAATPMDAAKAQTRQPLRQVPLIAGSGDCLAAMDTMRELMRAVPSGGLLPRAPAWAKLVSPRMGAVNRACGATTAQAFRDQEVLPWNNASVPGNVRIPAAPAA